MTRDIVEHARWVFGLAEMYRQRLAGIARLATIRQMKRGEAS